MLFVVGLRNVRLSAQNREANKMVSLSRIGRLNGIVDTVGSYG